MHLPGKYYLLFLLLFISSVVAAQNSYVLSGTIAGTDKRSVDAGDAFLLSAKDSVLVKYAPVADGKFSFDPVKAGYYLLKISCPGFEDEHRNVALTKDEQLSIALKRNATGLHEVEIVAAKKLFTNRNGNLHVNIENSVFSAVPDPVALLSKMPAVQVSPDGETVRVLGKGEPLFYIGNQRASLADLRSLSVNDIKSIEIINNPSARYEAEGRVVILISRKANKQEGIKADVFETAMFKRFYYNYAGANLSVKKNKLELKVNFQYNHLKQWESNGNDFTIADKQLESRYTVLSVGTRQQYVFGGGAYYQFNDDDYLSLSANARVHNDRYLISTDAYEQEQGTATSAITNTFNTGQRPYTSANLNYNKKLKRISGNLFIGGQYSGFTRSLSSNIFDNYNNTQFVPVQDRYQKYHVDVWTGRADYEQMLGNDIKWESGINLNSARSAVIFNTSNYNPQDSFRSDYAYTENILAAYTQLSGKLKNISYTAGLRAENTQVRGGFTDSANLQVDKNYTQLFPRMNISIPLDSTKSLTFDYARSIQRPDYATTSQVTVYINPFFEWSSNINLDPSVTDAVSATFQYKENSLQLSVYKQTNPVYDATEYNEAENRLHMISKNFAKESGIRLDLTVPWTYKIWTSTNILSGIISQVQDPAAVTGRSKPYFYLYSGNQFRLSKGYSFTLSGWAITKSYQGVFEMGSLFAVDLAVAKTFYKKLSCTISFNDMFRSLKSTQQFTVNGIHSDGVYYEDVRALAITLKYTLGNLRDARYKNKEVNENTDRIK